MQALVNLTELDMYDNKIKDVGEALDTLVNITYVIHLPVWSIPGRCLTLLKPPGRSICHSIYCERSRQGSDTFCS